MTDYPEEIHADACRARDARTWSVRYEVRATVEVYVEAPAGASDGELLRLAEERATVSDVVDWTDPEMVDAEVVG